jgi:hypothetical protein
MHAGEEDEIRAPKLRREGRQILSTVSWMKMKENILLGIDHDIGNFATKSAKVRPLAS